MLLNNTYRCRNADRLMGMMGSIGKLDLDLRSRSSELVACSCVLFPRKRTRHLGSNDVSDRIVVLPFTSEPSSHKPLATSRHQHKPQPSNPSDIKMP